MTERLDAALAARGIARSRTAAAKLIADGVVTVNGQFAAKPSLQVGADAVLEVSRADHYVSRAAHKLIAALDAFAIPVANRTALDAGASTGGFTQVLVERDAALVIALDVGHGQLHESIATLPEVRSFEGINVRHLDPPGLVALVGDTVPDLVTADLSFISLGQVLPALASVARSHSDFVLLIKPQFEVGRGGIREGIVHNAGLRFDAIIGVLWSAWDLGLGTAGLIASPILGTAGNREYLVWLSAERGTAPTEWAGEAERLADVQ